MLNGLLFVVRAMLHAPLPTSAAILSIAARDILRTYEHIVVSAKGKGVSLVASNIAWSPPRRLLGAALFDTLPTSRRHLRVEVAAIAVAIVVALRRRVV